jgi:hypothetical protein
MALVTLRELLMKTKLVQLAPWQRYHSYMSTPRLSVEAVQLRSISLLLTAVAVSPDGAVGGVVSVGVVAEAIFE